MLYMAGIKESSYLYWAHHNARMIHTLAFFWNNGHKIAISSIPSNFNFSLFSWQSMAHQNFVIKLNRSVPEFLLFYWSILFPTMIVKSASTIILYLFSRGWLVNFRRDSFQFYRLCLIVKRVFKYSIVLVCLGLTGVLSGHFK